MKSQGVKTKPPPWEAPPPKGPAEQNVMGTGAGVRGCLVESPELGHLQARVRAQFQAGVCVWGGMLASLSWP